MAQSSLNSDIKKIFSNLHAEKTKKNPQFIHTRVLLKEKQNEIQKQPILFNAFYFQKAKKKDPTETF